MPIYPSCLFICLLCLLTLGVHAQQGLQYLGLCVCVCLSPTIMELYTGYEAAHERYKQLLNYENLKIKVVFRLRSGNNYAVKCESCETANNMHNWIVDLYRVLPIQCTMKGLTYSGDVYHVSVALKLMVYPLIRLVCVKTRN